MNRLASLRFLVMAGVLAALAACTPTPVPIPADRAAYVGTWSSETTTLVIAAEGHVSYSFKEGNVSRSINAPLQAFKGNDFDAGIGPLSTTFVVQQPPRQDPSGWTMVVDGVALRKTAN